MTEPSILVTNINRRDLEESVRQLQEQGYATVGACGMEELDNVIKEQKAIRLALIYLSGLDDSIWQRCDGMHDAGIPFIVITHQRSPGLQRESIKHGADGLLVGPLGFDELLEHVRTVLGE